MAFEPLGKSFELRHEGAKRDADGMTLALQAFIALDQVSPIEPVIPWMRATNQWPFDGE